MKDVEIKKKETEEHQKEGNLRIYNGKDEVKLNQRWKKQATGNLRTHWR